MGDASILPEHDPASAAEVAVIVDHGMRRMLEAQQDCFCFYYVAPMNESQPQPSLPEGAEGGVIRGLYRRAAAIGRYAIEVAGAPPWER